MSEYAIKVDLTDFFTDERKWTLILVDGNWNCVEDLEKRVEFLFKLNGIHFVTNDGCFVPSQEPIRVISSADTLKAFVLNTPTSMGKAELSVVEETRKENKRKFESLEAGFVSSTPSQTAKRCKKLKKQKFPKLSNEQKLRSPEAMPIRDPGSFSSSTLVSVQPGMEQVEAILNTSNTSQHISKTLQGKENSIHPTNLLVNEQQEDDSVNHTKTFTNESSTNVVFRCALMDMPTNKARTFDLRPKNFNVEILEDIRLPSLAAGIPIHVQPISTDAASAENKKNSENTEIDVQESFMEQRCNESSVILLDDSEADDSKRNFDETEVGGSQLNEKNDISAKGEFTEITKMLENSESLKNLPVPGDVVLFKLFLTTSKNARVTEYIVASCDYVNRRSKQITYSLISFPAETKSLLKKCSASMDDSMDNINKIILKFSEMIAPRLLKT